MAGKCVGARGEGAGICGAFRKGMEKFYSNSGRGLEFLIKRA